MMENEVQTPEDQIPEEEISIEEPVPEEIPAEEVPVEAPLVEEAPAAVSPSVPPVVPAPKKQPRRRPWPLKILLGLVAFVLCIAMFGVTLAGALVMDLRVLTSKGGIKDIVTQLLLPTVSSDRLAPGLTMSAAQPSVETDSNTNALFDWIYNMVEDQFGQDAPIEKEQVYDFLDKSTVKDFMSDKIAGAVDDLINETNNTTITREEVMDLVKENKPLLEEALNVTITDQQINEIQEVLDEVPIFAQIEENGLAGVVENILAGGSGNPGETTPDGETIPGDETVPGEAGGTLGALQQIRELMAIIRTITSDTVLFALIGAFAALFLLVFLANFTLPKTLADTGIVLTFAGLILSAPNFVFISGVLPAVLPAELSDILGIAGSVLGVIGIVHYSILGAGTGLIVLSIVAKILKNARLKKKYA